MIKTIIWEDFRGGLNTEASRGALPPTASRRLKNLRHDAAGKLSHPGGRSAAKFTTSQNILAFTRYEKNGASRLIFVRGVLGANTWTVVSRDEAGASNTTIGTLTGAVGVLPQFAQVGEKLFITNPGGALQVWDGVDATAIRDVGLAAVTSYSLPTAFSLGAGNLNSIGYEGYNWAVTFASSTLSIESNPYLLGNGEVATATGAYTFEDERVRLEIHLPPNGAPVMPTNVNRIRVWRRGGRGGSAWRFAFEFTPNIVDATGLVYDTATGTFPEDNVADADLSLEELSLSNAQPPRGLEVLTSHGRRLWGAGRVLSGSNTTQNPSYLWCSRPDEPEAWGTDNNGVDDDGGNLRIDGDFSNPVLALSSTGGLLVAGRQKSVDTIYGDGFDGPQAFSAAQRSTQGVLAREAMRRCGNHVLWLATDKRVYRLTDPEPDEVSRPIRATLEGITAAALPSAVAAYHDKKYVLVVPSYSGSGPWAYAFDFLAGSWGEFSDSAFDALCLGAALPAGGAGVPELLFAKTTSLYAQFVPSAATDLAIDWQAGEDDVDEELPAGVLKRCVAIRVWGEGIAEGATPLYATVYAEGKTTLSRDHDFGFPAAPGGTGLLLDTGILPDLVGYFVYPRIRGSITAGAIARIEMDVSFERVRGR